MTDKVHTPIVNQKHHDGSEKAPGPQHKGGSAEQNARSWGGGSKASKGNTGSHGKHNENSSAKS